MAEGTTHPFSLCARLQIRILPDVLGNWLCITASSPKTWGEVAPGLLDRIDVTARLSFDERQNAAGVSRPDRYIRGRVPVEGVLSDPGVPPGPHSRQRGGRASNSP